MENARKTPKNQASAPSTGAAIVTAAGRMPQRRNTAIAEILSRLLAGRRITGMEGVIEASTTRTSAHIGALKRSHRWTVQRSDKVNGNADGRTVWITEYWLDPVDIDISRKAGADEWCAQVRAARRALRAKAAEARRNAAQVNARRAGRPHPGQSDLFGDEGGAA